MALLTLALSAALVVVAPLAYWQYQWQGAIAALAGAAVVWTASMLACIVSDRFRRQGEPLVSLLVGMLLRMFLPLGACLVVLLNGGPLAAAGFVYFVLAFYLLALPVETMLAVSTVQSHRHS